MARGRSTRPSLVLGVCGEHGGDPTSIAFFDRAGLDYVSCSPLRVPIARFVWGGWQLNRMNGTTQTGQGASLGSARQRAGAIHLHDHISYNMLLTFSHTYRLAAAQSSLRLHQSPAATPKKPATTAADSPLKVWGIMHDKS